MMSSRATTPPSPHRGERAASRVSRAGVGVGTIMVLAAAIGPARADKDLRPYAVVGNAIPASLTGAAGDAARGRTIVGSRQTGLCLLCHSGPFPEEKFQGTLAPDLKGAGARWSDGELRL